MPSYSREVKIPGLSAQQLYDRVSSEIDRVMDKVPVGKLEIERDPAQRCVTAKSSMFSATLYCMDGTLRLDGKLSLLATPFRPKIDEGIDRWLKKTFNL